MKKVFFLFFIFMFITALYADVFAPFISKLSAKAKQNSIVIKWKDCQDVNGTNIIYRSKDEINNSNFKYAERIAEIPMGKETYIDYPPDTAEYYYAVLLTGENDIPYNYIVPFRNSLSSPVNITSSEGNERAETAESGQKENQVFAPFVSNLKSSSDTVSVTLRWKDSEDVKGRNVVYRSTEEITNDNLESADKLTEIPMGTETYTDYPPDTEEYYYAVIIKDFDGRVYSFVIPFKNSTTHPVHIDKADFREETLASEEGSASEVFAPFISRLRASADNNSVLLNWIDTNDVEGRNVIFRYTDQITNKNIEDADRVAEMPMGQASFIDYPPDSREYFYAVLIKNNDGELYDYIIPFRNATSRPVNIESIAGESDIATDIRNITANNEGDKIFLSFSSSNPTREVLIYRHDKPITSSEDLLKANLLTKLDGGKMNYEDTPLAGVPFYYGVFDSGMIKLNNFVFEPGENITLKPAEVKVTRRGRASLAIIPRSQPLPLLLINSHIDDDKALSKSLHNALPEYKPLSPKTRAMVDGILYNMPLVKIDEMTPELLDTDKASDTRGENYTLQIILNEYFMSSDWDNVETEINDFFRTHHSLGIEYRAHFYLAQAYFFQGRYEESFLEFLLVKDIYYKQVTPWIDAVFRKLKNMQ